ncbi:winged helix-turn-helix domain-containing protein [Rhizobium sp. S152]|uniref:ATP-binding protein n=1 Tax=Rhizobium sp. S152 TaxID=3055038 RepID=UPI0025A93634|nr:winged helix-turn-helix domain-containing protein [Rhizobium sp. S152]MDM9628500.1 winged helix-turn-helix domain-containing protein [Rhizobium sp. S152]
MALGYHEFGAFRIFIDQRRLTLHGQDVRIGGRTYDVLLALVERHGQIVSREELGKAVWPNTHVVDSALRFQINSVRTILSQGYGRDYISSVAGRGYCFTAEVNSVTAEESAPVRHTPTVILKQIQMVGREDDHRRIAASIEESRLVTIVGPGGIGKTSIAVSTISRMSAAQRGAADFVDFSAVADGTLVATALASALGLAVFSGNPIPGIVAHLCGKPRLLVWDNCEHVIDNVAELAERLLGDVPNVTILATSREPMRVDGEHVYRLAPLSYPSRPDPSGAFLEYDAVSLFVARTKRDNIDWNDVHNRGSALEICRSLEGIPLAIELAATRVSDLGLPTVARLLGHSLSILTKNTKTAPDRHQTMRQALDWSYETLSTREADALRRMSVFSGGFTRDAAFAVAGGDYEGPVFCTSLSDLIYKSLVSVDVTCEPELYRLQQITREYGQDKLPEAERQELRRRHYSYAREIAGTAEADLGALRPNAWREKYSHFINDVRAALDWAFSAREMSAHAIRLTAESSALWMELGVLAEYRKYLDSAVRLIETAAVDADVEMKIMATYGMVSHHTEGATDRTRAAMRRALDLADELDNLPYQQRAITGIASERLTGGFYKQGLEWAREFERRFSVNNPGLCGRVLGHSLHHNGLFEESKLQVQQAYRKSTPNVVAIQNSGVQYDERLVLGTILSRNLWIQGYPDQSLTIVRECIDHAVTIDHSTSIGMAFSTSYVPLSLIMGDLELAAYANSILLDSVTRQSLPFWRAAAQFYQLAIDARNGSRSNDYHNDADRVTAHLGGPLLEVAAMAGDDLTTQSMLSRAESGSAEWCRPEIIRMRGERRKVEDKTAAEALFKQAIDMATGMGARSFKLRAETSLAKLLLGSAREAEGLSRLAAIYDNFDEGFSTRDLAIADRVLRDIGRANPSTPRNPVVA